MEYDGPHPQQGQDEHRHDFRREDDIIAHHVYKYIFPIQERLVKVETSIEYQKNNLDELKKSIYDMDHKLTKRIDDTSQQLLRAIEETRVQYKNQLDEHAKEELERYNQIQSLNQMVAEQVAQARYAIIGVGAFVAAIWAIFETIAKLGWLP